MKSAHSTEEEVTFLEWFWGIFGYVWIFSPSFCLIFPHNNSVRVDVVIPAWWRAKWSTRSYSGSKYLIWNLNLGILFQIPCSFHHKINHHFFSFYMAVSSNVEDPKLITIVYNSGEQRWVGFLSYYCALGPLIEEGNAKALKSPPNLWWLQLFGNYCLHP